jgi:hypothetical protein
MSNSPNSFSILFSIVSNHIDLSLSEAVSNMEKASFQENHNKTKTRRQNNKSKELIEFAIPSPPALPQKASFLRNHLSFAAF